MENVNDVLNGIVQTIRKNTLNYNTRIRNIKNNEDLSNAGKSEAYSSTHSQYNKIHDDLKEKLADTKSTARQDMKKDAFGVTGDNELQRLNVALINAEQSAQKGNDALTNLLGRYERMSDKIGMLACAHVAVDRGLSGTLNVYKTGNPERGKMFDNLQEFETSWGDLQDSKTKFNEKILTSGPRAETGE